MITAKFVISKDASLREAAEALNRLTAPYIFLIAVDDQNRVCGTLTDGDIRRAFLKGVNATARVTEVMGQASKLGREGEASRNETLLNSLMARPQFLPIVNEDGVLVDILTRSSESSERAIGFVMAGGKGTRLGALTENRPKPLIEVDGQPILGHVLGRLEEANIQKVFVSVNYLADQIETFVNDRISSASIELVWEDQPLGTAGAIGLVSERMTLPLVVLNGDIITNLDVETLIDAHIRAKNAVTIAVTKHEVEIPYGVVRHTEDGRFIGIDEKPKLSHFVSAGVYVLSPEVCTLIPNNRQVDMPEAIELANEIGLQVGVFPIHEYWIDVGHPSDLERARTE